MVPVVLEVRVTIDGDEVWFHREMDLPYVPFEGMTFEFQLVGPPNEDRTRLNGWFEVVNVAWVERDGKTYVALDEHPDEEKELKVEHFNPTVWKEGQKEAWRW